MSFSHARHCRRDSKPYALNPKPYNLNPKPIRNITYFKTHTQHQILQNPYATTNTSTPIRNIKYLKTHMQHQTLQNPYATSNTSNTTSIAYCIWRVISPVSSLHQFCSSLGLFAEYSLFYRALLQPIAFGESFLQSQVSINSLVL